MHGCWFKEPTPAPSLSRIKGFEAWLKVSALFHPTPIDLYRLCIQGIAGHVGELDLFHENFTILKEDPALARLKRHD